MEEKSKSRKKVINHVHKRILTQLSLFGIISVVMFGIVMYDVIAHGLNIAWVLLGAFIGIGVGLIAGRAFKLHWHDDSQQVIMRVDRTGIVIILLYILLRSTTNQISSEFFHGIQLIVITYSILGGVMIGRVVSMWRRIQHLLREQEII